MATEIPTMFTKYALSEEEELSGIQFTQAQRQYIQNIIADAAEEKVRLTFDPLNPNAFVQREAELQGQIGVLSSLLNKYTEYLDSLAATNT